MIRVQIRDQEALASLTPENLRAYLESQGWGNDRPWGQWGTILSKEQRGKLWEIVIPLRDGGYGYAEFMGLMVATLADAEDRSQLDVFYDLANPMVGTVPQGNRKGDNEMTNVWCVRSEFGKYTDNFVSGGYAAVGWIRGSDLTGITDREEFRRLYRKDQPQDADARVGANVGQVYRFMVDVKPGDYIITPTTDSALLRYGRVESDPYYEPNHNDGCPFPHRRHVAWEEQPFNRKELSMPLQYSMRAQKTVFAIKHREDFLLAIGHPELVGATATEHYDAYDIVLKRLLDMDAQQFEILVGHLLTAIGFDDPQVVGKPGDGGVDVTGDLNVSGLATVKFFVQVKRYALGSRVNANSVKQLRSSIPQAGQGAFITTAGFQKSAFDVASEQGFPPIGLINGHQLVDLLIEHWAAIDPEFQDQLGLKPGLVPA